MILFPNAKINIGLDITARRSDGYHEIETVMCPVGWSDILEIVPGASDKTTLTVTGRKVDCPPEKNLVMKAFRALETAIGDKLPPVDIYLRKIVPDGAGLGGGSSDAAFTLRGVNEVLSLGFSLDRLAEIAATVGADCPFFIYNVPMLATGIGTTLEPIDLDLSGLTVVIVKPAESVPTAEAYRGITPTRPMVALKERLSGGIEAWRDVVTNAFEATVGRQIPAIGEIKDRLTASGAVYTAMSGSGSAVFGLFKSDILADDIRQIFADRDIFIGSLG